MNLAVLHYHLSSGGVTRVIANHLLSLDRATPEGERLRVMLLFDGQTDGWPEDLERELTSTEIIVRALPALGYHTETAPATGRLADDLARELGAAGFDPERTVLHAHNHSLGKNAHYPAALRRLAEQGYAELLQPHDFAEDFRPTNYRYLRQCFSDAPFSEQVYFQGPRVHYATLNRRDQNVLAGAGVPRERLHFLPNPVTEGLTLPSREESRERLRRAKGVPTDAEFMLYPVRGIRRKNVGEFVLLSVLRNGRLRSSTDSRSSTFGITLDPQNPIAIPYYQRWQRLAGELGLSCQFGVGQAGGLTFPENLAAADRIVTTSVAEGFGMVFLESWLAGRGLVGRNLPEITSDFVDSGLQLDALYDRLNVPLDWIGKDALVEAISAACRKAFADFGIDVPTRDDVDRSVDALTVDGLVDFGVLDESLQEAVIRRTAGDAASCEVVLAANPSLSRWESIGEPAIADNRAVVRDQYSLAASGERLWDVYRSLLECSPPTVDGAADADALLNSFLGLDRFRLIRT